MGERLNRRDFLIRASLATAGVALAGCKPPLSEPSPIPKPEPPTRPPLPTKEPTKKSTKEPRPTDTPEPTTTLEPPKILETIDIPEIPNLEIERYSVQFRELTDKVPSSFIEELSHWVSQPEIQDGIPKRAFSGARYDQAEEQCGLSFLGRRQITPHRSERFYFNGDKKRIYQSVTRGRNYLAGRDHTQDLEVLESLEIHGWLGITELGLSCDGKVLYRINAQNGGWNHAYVIADYLNGTKTFIRDSEWRYCEPQLTADGSKLLMVFPDHPYHSQDGFSIDFREGEGGIHLINLEDWSIQFSLVQTQYPSRSVSLNENGSRLYSQVHHSLYNTETGMLVSNIKWPKILSYYTHHGEYASPNLKFVQLMAGMFEAGGWVEGQWGIMVHTPEGFFLISAKERSMIPNMIYNDGTIVNSKGDVFGFKNGTYYLVETTSEEPIEVRIKKIENLR